MTTTIPIKAIELLPGSSIKIHDICWQDFEEILAELDESSPISTAGDRLGHE